MRAPRKFCTIRLTHSISPASASCDVAILTLAKDPLSLSLLPVNVNFYSATSQHD